MSETDHKILCRNIFKDGKSTTSKDKFTRAWIDLVNRLEKGKNSVTEKR